MMRSAVAPLLQSIFSWRALIIGQLGRSATAHDVKIPLFIFAILVLTGCAKDDARLHGTWRSNREATVEAAFERDPRWTNATPDRIAAFSDLFGHMTISYSNRTVVWNYQGDVQTLPYQVVERGADFVVIRIGTPLEGKTKRRIRFVDGGNAYWIETGFLGNGLEERFDRVTR